MNLYRIQHRVKTLAQLAFISPDGSDTEPIHIDGYSIKQVGYNIEQGIYGYTWIVEKVIDGVDGMDALNNFRRTFKKIANKLSFISQCCLYFLDQSRLIERLNDNEDKEFRMFFVREKDPTGLFVTQSELNDFDKLELGRVLNDSPFYEYMHAYNNAIGYHDKLSLLCSALEALAGKVTKVLNPYRREELKKILGEEYSQFENFCIKLEDLSNDEFYERSTYNKKIMKKVLGAQYYTKVFGRDGLRHKIQHGDFIYQFNSEDYVDLIYKKILDYFNKEFDTSLDLGIVSSPRTFYKNLQALQFFLKPEDKTSVLELEEILEKVSDIDRGILAVNQYQKGFCYVNRNSEGY